MKKVFFSLLAVMGLSTTVGHAENHIVVLTPQEFIHQAEDDSAAVILDVRTQEEFAEGHLAGAKQLDFLDTTTFEKGMKELCKDNTYYIYCRSGRRSHGACEKMKAQGFKVLDMEGGFLNWVKQGLPVEK